MQAKRGIPGNGYIFQCEKKERNRMKNRSKKLVALLLGASMMMSLLAGCASSGETDTTTEAEVTTEVETEAEVEEETQEEVVEEETTEITITDITGATVTLDQPATKLVGTHNPTMNIAVIIGGGGQYVAGFGNKEMASGLYAYVFPELDDVTQIGKGSEINYEECLAVEADLAILPERFASLVEPFGEVEIPAAVVLPSDESYDTIVQSLELVGALVGEDERAAEIITYFNDSIAEVEALVADVEESPTALFLGSSTSASVANGTMLQSMMMETAGITNLAKDVEGEGGFIEVSVEEIIGWNPEIIYIPSYASYTVEDILNDAAWSEIDAVKEGKVYVFPSETLEPWDYPTPSVALGLSWLVYTLYPEVHSLDDVVADANEYYEFIYGVTFTVEEMGLE